MAANREPIFAALFARMGTLVPADQITTTATQPFVMVSRFWRGFSALDAGQQPCLFLVKGDEQRVNRTRGMPPHWVLTAGLVIACRGDETDPNTPPSTVLNNLITAVETMLQRQPLDGPAAGAPFMDNPDKGMGTTLGGLCVSCDIVGPIHVEEDESTRQAYAVIPLEIITSAVAA